MKFIYLLNEKSRKMKKTGWKISIILLIIFFIKYPDGLSGIPVIGLLFNFINSVFEYVSEFDLVKNIELSVFGQIINELVTVLSFVSLIVPVLWILSVFAVPITNAIIRRSLKKNNDSGNVVFASSEILPTSKKIEAFYKLKKLQEASTPVFSNDKRTFLRVQKMYKSESEVIRFSSSCDDVIYEWNGNNRIVLPYKFCGDDCKFEFHLNDDYVEIFSDSENTGNRLTLNAPVGCFGLSDSGEGVLLFVITWIGDVI